MNNCDCGAHKVKDAFHANWCSTLNPDFKGHMIIGSYKIRGEVSPSSDVVYNETDQDIVFYDIDNGWIITRPGGGIDRRVFPKAATNILDYNFLFKERMKLP